jgi:hypothetical protein
VLTPNTFVRFLGGSWITNIMTVQKFEIMVDEFGLLYVIDTISKWFTGVFITCITYLIYYVIVNLNHDSKVTDCRTDCVYFISVRGRLFL